MPALGPAQDTGKVIRWLKAAGDLVHVGDPLVEVETNKVTVEIESDTAGVIDRISAAEGDDVPVGAVIAMIYGIEEKRVSPEQIAAHAHRVGPTPPAATVVRPAAGQAGGGGRRPFASPKARRLAAAHGVEVADLTGTGPRGAVQASDVLMAVAAAVPGGGETAGSGLERQSRIWERMAARLSESWRDAPHFLLQREIDASELLRWKDACNSRASDPVMLTDALVSACADLADTVENPHVLPN